MSSIKEKKNKILACLSITLIVIIILSIPIFFKRDDKEIQSKMGKIISIEKNVIVFQTSTNEKYIAKVTSNTDFEVGNDIRVLYKGALLETSPIRFKHIVKIERISS